MMFVLYLPKNMSRNARKPVFGASDQVRHKPGCAATEDVWLRKKRGCTIQVAKTKALISFREADLRLCFCICKNPLFSCCGSYMYNINPLWQQNRNRMFIPVDPYFTTLARLWLGCLWFYVFLNLQIRRKCIPCRPRWTTDNRVVSCSLASEKYPHWLIMVSLHSLVNPSLFVCILFVLLSF